MATVNARSYLRVAHLTSAHPRSDVRVFWKECRTLAVAGYTVTLIVADGKGNAVCDGVSVVDVGEPLGRRDRMLRTVNAVAAAAVALGVDVYHLHDPELLRVAGFLRRTGARVVFDAHEDLQRQVLSKSWIPRILRGAVAGAVGLMLNRAARRLDGIVAATPHIAALLLQVNPRTVSINNYPLPDELWSGRQGGVRHKQVCYVGGITRMRGIEPLVRALPLVPDVTLVLCGKFQERDCEAAMRALPGWSQVDYRGFLDRDGVRRVLAESSAGMVTLLPTPAYVDALPVKMFEYMSAELPVIASDFPLWRRIVGDAGAGVCVDSASPEAIADAIRRLIDDSVEVDRMGRAGRKAVLEQYNWPGEAAKLIDFYKGLQ